MFNRLEFIRSRAGTRLPLSEKAAALLEQIKKDDPDLGGPVSVGEVLAPDDVRRYDRPEKTPDEENDVNTELISPLMREAVEP